MTIFGPSSASLKRPALIRRSSPISLSPGSPVSGVGSNSQSWSFNTIDSDPDLILQSASIVKSNYVNVQFMAVFDYLDTVAPLPADKAQVLAVWNVTIGGTSREFVALSQTYLHNNGTDNLIRAKLVAHGTVPQGVALPTFTLSHNSAQAITVQHITSFMMVYAW